MTTDDRAIDELKGRIAGLEAQLHAAYTERRELFIEMSATMTRREIGARWEISDVAVTHAINRDKYKIPRGWANDLPTEA